MKKRVLQSKIIIKFLDLVQKYAKWIWVGANIAQKCSEKKKTDNRIETPALIVRYAVYRTFIMYII